MGNEPVLSPEEGLWLFGLLLTFLGVAFVIWRQRSIIGHNARLEAAVAQRTAEIRQSEEKLRSVIENSADGIITIDRHGNVLSVNRSAARIFGYGEEELVGRSLGQLLPESERKAHQAYLDESTLHAQRIINKTRDLYGRRKDGSVFALELAVGRIGDGEDTGFVGILRDISERKAAEEQLRLSNRVFESSPNLIAVVSADHRYIQVNPAYAASFDKTPDEVAGRPVSEILGETAYASTVKANLEQCFGGEELRLERWLPLSRGRRFFEVSYLPLRDERGDIERVVAIAHDLTGQRLNEEAARLSANQLRLATDSLPALIAFLDSELCYVFVNAVYEDWFGINPDQVVGKTPRELLGDGAFELVEKELRAALDGHPQSFDSSIMHRDGKRRHVHRTYVPHRDDTGRVVGLFALVQDITERVEAEARLAESERRFRAYTATASDWVWETDAEHHFTFISDRFFEITDFSPTGVIGRRRWDYVGQDVLARSPAIWEAHRADMEAHRPFRAFRYVTTTPAGQQVHISLSGDPVFDADGGFLGYRGTGTDVTALAEAQIALEQAKEEAEKADRAKSEFLSSMSHELRTPLNAVLGFGQLLAGSTKEPLSDKQRKCVEHILSGGNHLLELINEVLDLSKIEAGRLDLAIEDVPLAPLIDDCLSLSRTLADARGIAVTGCTDCPSNSQVRVDSRRLKQVLLNLISNAIKYNSKHGQVTIACGVTPEGGRRIRVCDTGPGIPEDRQAELFKPFSRLGAETTAVEGTGIGLTLSKKLIEAMGGAIGYRTTAGEGSEFWIDLPVPGAGERPASALLRRTAPREWHPPEVSATLLYVEDNPANLELMRHVIEDVPGLALIAATTAEEGLELAETHKPDAIVLDVNLPGMNGIEALGKLRDSERTEAIPVLALSAAATPDDVERGIEAGFRAYLTKPMNVEEVVAAVKAAVESPA